MSELVGRTLELLAETKGGFVSAVKNIFNTRTMATLKLSDLSVGDWVEIDHEDYGWHPARINVCGDLGIGVYFKDIDTEEEYDCTLSQARPIPITPEILEANGWRNDGMYATLRIDEHRHLEYYYHEHRLRKWYCGVDEWENHAKINDITFAAHCYSVHQLQHALRLAGVDKEIVIHNK